MHFFFFNDTATTEIYTLSLHDALPIYPGKSARGRRRLCEQGRPAASSGLHQHPRDLEPAHARSQDRKSTRLNSSHLVISYAVFCLKKKQLDLELCCHSAGIATRCLAAT